MMDFQGSISVGSAFRYGSRLSGFSAFSIAANSATDSMQSCDNCSNTGMAAVSTRLVAGS